MTDGLEERPGHGGPGPGENPGDLPTIGASTAVILRLFLGSPATPRDAWDVTQETGLDARTVYPVIARMRGVRWLVAAHADPDDRPARTCYTMPPAAAARARQRLAEMAAEYDTMSWARLEGTSWRLIGVRLGYNSSQAVIARYEALARALGHVPGTDRLPAVSRVRLWAACSRAAPRRRAAA